MHVLNTEAYFLSFKDSYERCFPTEPLTTSPAVLTGDGGSYPNEQLEYGLSIVGIVVCCAVLVWIVRTRLRHRRNAKEVMSGICGILYLQKSILMLIPVSFIKLQAVLIY